MRIKRDVIIGRDPVITIALIRALTKNKKKNTWKLKNTH